MQTLIRTRKHFTGNKHEPLHQVSEKIDTFQLSGGRPLGEAPVAAAKRGVAGTPPRQNSKSTDLDKTPPAEAKVLRFASQTRGQGADSTVLPWVERVETGTIPDGMFGPYESLPPTRMPTMHEVGTEQRQRLPHPFAYGATTVPFSAMDDYPQQDIELPSLPQKDSMAQPGSDALSRGAGLRARQEGIVAGNYRASRTEAGTPEGGTFGEMKRNSFSPRKAATSRADSPIKASPILPVPTHSPPLEPLPQVPKPSAPRSRKAVPAAARDSSPERDEQPHIHHPHHEFPFSHKEAAEKQAAAVEEARAAALARLQAAGGDGPDALTSDKKGPRETYDTAASGPSFGHINHWNGHPVSSRQSAQQPVVLEQPMSVPMSRDVTGASFYRIPFGVPVNMALPRPMMLMRTGTGAGMGVGIGSVGIGARIAALEDLAEESEKSKRRDDRSAYVETVEDEQDPKTPKSKPKQSLHSVDSGATHIQAKPAKPESELNPLRMSQHTMRAGQSGHRGPVDPAVYPPATASVNPPTIANTVTNGNKPPTHAAKSIRSLQPELAPSEHTLRQLAGRGPSDKGTETDQTFKSPVAAGFYHTQDQQKPHQHTDSTAASIAPTSASNVKKIVKDSSFHDETLCELLEAARLNLIGPEAKKALQRAARARVIELKDMRKHDQGPAALPTPPDSIEKRSRSKAKHSAQPSHSTAPNQQILLTPVLDESTPPKWAQALTDRMGDFDARFVQLAQQQRELDTQRAHVPVQASPTKDEADSIPQELINDLIFPGLPTSAFTAGMPPFFPTGQPPVITTMSDSPQQSAKIRPMPPSHRPRENSGDVTLTWGSEVELPSGAGASPPKPSRMAPTINIQPPTESNARTRLASVPSRTDPRTPVRTEVDLVEEFIIPGSGMADKSLPDTPDAREHSVRSIAPSPEEARAIVGAQDMADYFSEQQAVAARSDATTPIRQVFVPHESQFPSDPSALTFEAVTAPTHVTRLVPNSFGKPGSKDVIHIMEVSDAPHSLGPWDQVTQRLYAWALVWEEESFVKALENLALGRQVEAMPLTVFSMMTFKRLVKRNLTDMPQKFCDKLFVPPIMAEAINKAVHNKQIDDARQILEELWYTWGFKSPPRVVTALAKHRNEPEKWSAHRFDLSTGHLTTYGVTSEQQNLPDGRPFMWWHAIRAAWPEYHIPNPEQLKQRVEWVITPRAERSDNSLKALNYARNLLLGFRPELARDLGKLRETVWEEVKRLLQKKRSGHLVVRAPRHEH